METTSQGQAVRSAAEVYEAHLVPALFGEWAPRVADVAGITAGDRVLDVACGTGVLAREAARRVGTTGRVVGLDRNDDMLDVARQRAPGIEWVTGTAEDLPFPDASFESVGCQFGLMFFDDRAGALAGMWRVLCPGGRLAVAVWDAAGRVPGHGALIVLLDRLFGAEVANTMRAPFALGDPAELARLAGAAAIPNARVQTLPGIARFPSIDAWVYAIVRGWALSEMIDDAGLDLLRREAEIELAQFRQPDGSVMFDAPAHVLTATR